MQFLSQYYSANESNNSTNDSVSNDQSVTISAQQASLFAKQIAGDFNPIHDPESRRFCVPGDLLFAIALDKYGLNSKMAFQFLSLVGADSVLAYPSILKSTDCQSSDSQNTSSQATSSQNIDLKSVEAHQIEVINEKDKRVLGLQYSGQCTKDGDKLEQVLRQYVQFSGHNFPHILVPLMKQHNVMINPKRPLVIYESMTFEFTSLDFNELTITLGETNLVVDGKRGNATLNFTFKGDGNVIGSGSKALVLSGLREYEESAVEKMCSDYEASKSVS